MKAKCMLAIILFIFAFSGCVTEKEVIREREVIREVPITDTLMPVTNTVLERLGESTKPLSESIKDYQFVLFGRILLERERTDKIDSLDRRTGTYTFVNDHVRESITIRDQLEGQAQKIEINNNRENILYLSFENNPNLQLMFSANSNDADGFFYLKYTQNNDFNSLTDEKGTLDYGEHTYRLKYSGDKAPYLFIRLNQRDRDRVEARSAPGRRAGQLIGHGPPIPQINNTQSPEEPSARQEADNLWGF
jgi:hypothetical protein